MYNNNRDAYRKTLQQAWQKYQKRLALEPVEQQIVAVVLAHPEYQVLLQSEKNEHENYAVEENPYLHIGLHISINEQLSTNRPLGISPLFQKLCEQYEDEHQAQHAIMQVLANYMWQMQQQGLTMQEQDYLQQVQALVDA